MVWLQSNEKYTCVAKFDPNTGNLKKYSRNELNDDLPALTEGFFSEVEDCILLIYRVGNSLYFRVDETDFILDEYTKIEVSGPPKKRKLSVIKNGEEIFKITYKLIGPGPISNDLTPFVEDEDFDFGLFASNISKNSKRKEVLLGKA